MQMGRSGNETRYPTPRKRIMVYIHLMWVADVKCMITKLPSMYPLRIGIEQVTGEQTDFIREGKLHSQLWVDVGHGNIRIKWGE